MISFVLFAVMLAAPGVAPTVDDAKKVEAVNRPPDMGGFVGGINMGGRLAIMDGTVVILDGKPTAWEDVPDDGTELVEITIDVKRRMVIRIVYRTLKDF